MLSPAEPLTLQKALRGEFEHHLLDEIPHKKGAPAGRILEFRDSLTCLLPELPLFEYNSLSATCSPLL